MIEVHAHGDHGPRVVVVHGGPGAPGSVRGLCRLIADRFRVLEPFQRRSGETPLTVARHVEDLEEVIAGCCAGEPPAVVGHSWGAMLALAHAAAHPSSVASLAIVGCGSFDLAARAALNAERNRRLDGPLRGRLDAILARAPGSGEEARLRAAGDVFLIVDSHDIGEAAVETEWLDPRGMGESWADMVRLQEAGVYPAAFAAITAPVLMLHGADDPHPGRMIRDSLARVLPGLPYREFPECGHYPWLERRSGEAFLEALRGWLASRRDGGPAGIPA